MISQVPMPMMGFVQVSERGLDARGIVVNAQGSLVVGKSASVVYPVKPKEKSESRRRRIKRHGR